MLWRAAYIITQQKRGLAVNGDAHCIITGDSDLLALHPFRGVSILTPKAFLRSQNEIGGQIV